MGEYVVEALVLLFPHLSTATRMMFRPNESPENVFRKTDELLTPS